MKTNVEEEEKKKRDKGAGTVEERENIKAGLYKGKKGSG